MLDKGRIAAIVRSRLSEREAATAVVRWDSTPRSAGERYRLGPEPYEMPFDGQFVFIDLVPGANWSHPARVVLIGAGEDEVESFEARFPPFPDAAYPPSFELLDLAVGTGRRRRTD